MGLSAFVQHYRKAILLLTVLLCLGGFYASQALPVAIFPDLTAPRIIVSADAGDTPIPTVLANITRPLENAVAGVPGVARVHSLTQRGGDELDVNFNWGTDMASTLQQVQARIATVQAALPPGTNVTAERLNPSVFPVMGYSLYSKTVSQQELRRLALYTLRPRLLRVPGVREIAVQGGDTPEFLVELNPTALLARGVSASDVENALAKNNEINAVGHYEQSFLRYQILVSGLFSTTKDIANVTVAVKDRVPVTVGEVGTVRQSVEAHTVEASGDGRPAVLLNIIKQPTGNTVQVSDGIKKALAEAAPLLPDVTVTSFYDQADIVIGSQHSVIEALILGGALALVVLMFFLGNLRTAAIVLIILPLTVVITFALMKLLGQTMNIMTLGALAVALGLVIDDGIVVVENMFHELESGKERPEAIAAGLKAITPAMIGSSLTTMAAFLPLTFLNDLTGQFFGPLSLVMIATLAVSLALSLLLTPILAGWLLPPRAEAPAKKPSFGARILGFFPRQFDRIVRVYSRVLGWCLRRRAVVLLLLLPLIFGTYFLYNRIETGFFPEFDEGGFVLDYQLPAGTSLAESSKVAGQIEAVLAHTPEVAAWSRRTGAQLGFDITTENRGDMSVRLKSDRTRGIDEVMDDVRTQVTAKFPAADVDFHQTLQDNIGDIAGSPNPVEVKIFGPDQATLETLAQQVDGVLAKLPYIVGDVSGVVHSNPEAVLNINTDRAQRYGLTADDITQAADGRLAGGRADPRPVGGGGGRRPGRAGPPRPAARPEPPARHPRRLPRDRRGHPHQRGRHRRAPARCLTGDARGPEADDLGHGQPERPRPGQRHLGHPGAGQKAGDAAARLHHRVRRPVCQPAAVLQRTGHDTSCHHAAGLHPAGLPVPLDPPGRRPAAGRHPVPVRRPLGTLPDQDAAQHLQLHRRDHDHRHHHRERHRPVRLLQPPAPRTSR